MMSAVVLSAPARLDVRRVPRPEPRAHEVLARVTAVGLCGTDFHIYAGEANYHRDPRGRVVPLSEAPQILGHEIAAAVEQPGANVRDLRAGDRIVIDQGRNCMSEAREPRCEYCDSGDSHQCAHYREHGITGLPGGLAEFIAVPAVNAVKVESGLRADAAALTEPLACVVHAMDVTARSRARFTLHAGDNRAVRAILVCGAGPAGLLFVQYLRRVLEFRGTLLVSDPNARKRALAERFGAQAIDPATTPLGETVRDRTGGRGVDLLIEASGAGAVFTDIPQVIRKQATVVLYGHGHGGTDLSVLNAVQFMEPTLLAPAGASGGFEADGRPSTYVRALRLIEHGTIDVASLITHRYRSLAEVPAAFGGGQTAADYVKGVILLEERTT